MVGVVLGLYNFNNKLFCFICWFRNVGNFVILFVIWDWIIVWFIGCVVLVKILDLISGFFDIFVIWIGNVVGVFCIVLVIGCICYMVVVILIMIILIRILVFMNVFVVWCWYVMLIDIMLINGNMLIILWVKGGCYIVKLWFCNDDEKLVCREVILDVVEEVFL